MGSDSICFRVCFNGTWNLSFSVIVRHRDTETMVMRGKVDILKSLETGDTACHTRLPKKQQGPTGSIKTKQMRQDKEDYFMSSRSGIQRLTLAGCFLTLGYLKLAYSSPNMKAQKKEFRFAHEGYIIAI